MQAWLTLSLLLFVQSQSVESSSAELLPAPGTQCSWQASSLNVGLTCKEPECALGELAQPGVQQEAVCSPDD